MKVPQKILLIVFTSMLFVTCKKEELPQGTTTEGQPVFSFTGTINGLSTNWSAGVNNYYMYSSYTQNPSSGLYSFIGSLQSTLSTNNSFQVIINDYKASSPGTPAVIDSSLSITASYGYTLPAGNISGYTIKFTPVIAGTALSYLYNFGDGTTSSVVSPTHIYKDTGNYTTTLKVSYSGYHVTKVNPITITGTQPQLWIDSIHPVVIIDTLFNQANVNFTATIQGGTPPYTYAWNFGDLSPIVSRMSDSINSTVTHLYDSINRIFPITLKVTDHSGKSQNYSYNVLDGSYDAYYVNLVNYKMSPPQPVANPLALSDITINYTDTDGNTYTSKNASQPGNSTFQILSVSNYQNNSANQTTKMLKLTFSCMLYNTSMAPNGVPANGTAIIAVAYH